MTANTSVYDGRALGRRHCLAALLGAAAVVVVGPAEAGSYLDRAAMLLGAATREADYLRARLSDRELARAVQRVAAARVKAASTMEVPKEVAQAHPHLLLVLEGYERAAAAAMAGQTETFLVRIQHAREEEAVFRGVLKQLGWTLPPY